MARGIFTHIRAYLPTDGRMAIEDVKSVLQAQGFEIVKVPSPKDPAFGGPGLTISFLPAVSGYVAVDVMNQPWPDAMGGSENGCGDLRWRGHEPLWSVCVP
jgi:hypothetical protein